MKRIAFETRLYDYSTKEEAQKHIYEMANRGWGVVSQGYKENGYTPIHIYENGNDELPYSVEFTR